MPPAAKWHIFYKIVLSIVTNKLYFRNITGDKMPLYIALFTKPSSFFEGLDIEWSLHSCKLFDVFGEGRI